MQDRGSVVRARVFVQSMAGLISCAVWCFKPGLIREGIYGVDGTCWLHARVLNSASMVFLFIQQLFLLTF